MSNEKPQPSAAGADADLEKIPVDQVLAKLGVQANQGLSSAEAKQTRGTGFQTRPEGFNAAAIFGTIRETLRTG